MGNRWPCPDEKAKGHSRVGAEESITIKSSCGQRPEADAKGLMKAK
jgi:hypothetical protein